MAGEVSDTAITEYCFSLEEAISYHDPAAVVSDWSVVGQFTVAPNTLSLLAKKRPHRPNLPYILIAPQDLIYGFARMFQAFSSDVRHCVYVVRSEREANQLLQQMKLIPARPVG